MMHRHERALRELGQRYGCRLEKRRRHWQLRHPNGAVVTVAATPSDVRALENVEGDLRRELREQQEPTVTT